MGFGGDCDFGSMIREALLRNRGPEMGPRVGIGVSEERAFIAEGTIKVLRKQSLLPYRLTELKMAAVEGQRVRTDEDQWAQADGVDLFWAFYVH